MPHPSGLLTPRRLLLLRRLELRRADGRRVGLILLLELGQQPPRRRARSVGARGRPCVTDGIHGALALLFTLALARRGLRRDDGSLLAAALRVGTRARNQLGCLHGPSGGGVSLRRGRRGGLAGARGGGMHAFPLAALPLQLLLQKKHPFQRLGRALLRFVTLPRRGRRLCARLVALAEGVRHLRCGIERGRAAHRGRVGTAAIAPSELVRQLLHLRAMLELQMRELVFQLLRLF